MDKKNIPVYGARILFWIIRTPNDKTYIRWTDSIYLTTSLCYTRGPFNFDFRSDIIRPKQYINFKYWEFILTTCSTLGFVPPIVSTLTDNKSSKNTDETCLKIKYFDTIIFYPTYYPTSSHSLDIIHSHICVYLHYFPYQL